MKIHIVIDFFYLCYIKSIKFKNNGNRRFKFRGKSK